MRRHMSILVGLSTLLLASVGCDMGGSSSLNVQVVPYDLASNESGVVSLPNQHEFSITEFSAERRAEMGGTADSSGQAKANGTASLSAIAADGGVASASFNLGHAIRNASDRQAQTTISVAFDYVYVAKATPDIGLPSANVSLELIIKNRRTRETRRVSLVNYTTEQGNGQEDSRKQYTATMTLTPGDICDIYLSGSASVTTKSDRSAESTLNVTGLKITLDSTVAPSIEAGQ